MDKPVKSEHELLVEAGILLASSLDYKVTLSNVAHLITRAMADWCAIDLIDEEGSIQRVAVSHIDPAKETRARELQQRYPVLRPQEKHTITQRVLQRGETWLDPDVSEVRLAAEARDTEHYLLLKELGFTSEIVVPLIAHTQVLGTLTLVLGEGTRRYNESDKRLVEELARRIALAVDNAQLFKEVQAQREWFQVTLSSIGDGVIATDADACIVFMNAVASALTGWSFDDAQGHEVEIVFHIINEHTRALVRTPIRQALEEGIKVGLANHTLLVARDGTERPISDSGAPIQDRDGRTIGAVLVFRDVSDQRAAELELKASEARYRDLIENANDIIYTLDLAGNLTSLNKAGEGVLGYAAHELLNQPLARIFDPAELEMMEDKLKQKVEGEIRTQYEVNVRRKNGDKIALEINSQLITVNGLPAGVYGIARDVTERKRNEQRINLLFELSQAFSQALTVQQVAEVMAESAIRVLGASIATVCLLTDAGTTLEILGLRGLSFPTIEEYRRMPLDFSSPLTDSVRGKEVIWLKTRDEYVRRYPYLETAIERNGSHSIICIPLRIDNKVIGAFSLSFPFEKARTPDEEALHTTLANLCAQSLERARLFEEENEARKLAESLQATGNALNSALELSDVFDQILNNIDRIVPHDLADIMLVDKGVGRIVRSRGYSKNGLVKNEQESEKITVNVAGAYYFHWAAEHKQPCVIEDAKSDPNWVQLQSPDVIRSNINAPILIDGVIAGFLNVNSLVPNFYTSKDADILQIFANQAAIAIKHAQLHQQAVATAAMEERQRIARDLHDAVSQTLFSANLIAESLPRLWERRPDQAREQTQAVHRLTQAAAAEMRVLLFELRPESLVNTNLRELLTQLAHSIPGRRDLEISLIIRGWNDQLLPPDVQIAFYRIAQESLNNVLKHGRSRQVRIRMHRYDKVLRLDIMDNGRGFDTTNISGGIGLKSMWERAGSVGAVLDIKSRVGLGTRVRLTWSEAET